MGKKGSAVLLIVAAFISISKAREFQEPSNTVGAANCFGNLQFTSHLGAVELSREEIFDFHYTYTSYSGANSPHLGKGFFVPMLEGFLIDHDYFLEASTLGGNIVYMYRLPAEPDTYVSLSGRDRTRKLGDDSYERSTEEGFVINYRLGRIVRIKTPKGAVLTLDYDGKVCKTIRSSSGGVVCSFQKTGDKKAVFTTARGKHELLFQRHPQAEAGDQNPDTLSEIAWPSGSKTTFSYRDDNDESNLRMTMQYDKYAADYVWAKSTKEVVEAEDVSYRVRPLRRDVDYEAERRQTGVYSVERRYPDGSWDRFMHDEDGGYSDLDTSDGKKFRTHYINTRGPIFNLVRKRERIFPGASDSEERKKTVYEAFYDTEGKLIREVIDGTVNWHLRPEGLPASVVKKEDNFRQYDQKGRVQQSRWNGTVSKTTWMTDGSRRVVSTHPWGEVYLRYYSSKGDLLAMPASEKFPERNSKTP